MLGGIFAISRGLIDTLFDVARLLAHFANHAASVRVKNAIAVRVSDVANGLSRTLFEIELGVACDLTRQHNQVAFGQRFARDAAERVLLKTGIENVIADRIADFVWMTFGDRFGGKNETMRHEKK